MQKINSRAKTLKKRKRMIGLVAICLIAVLLFSTAAAASKDKHGLINIKVKSETMVQEQAMPTLTVDVSCKENLDVMLDVEKKYTVGDLVKDLKAGTAYTLDCKADGITEGVFPIQVTFSDTVKKELDIDWLVKVRIDVENGTLTVQNKYGTWDGNKFKRTDGTYVVSDFIVSMGKTYYFGADENKAIGWQDLNSTKYYFDKDGVMQVGWFEEDGAKYYFNPDGTMKIGWLEEEGTKYAFGKDGKMLTGEQQVGSKKCVFAKDGKIESEIDSIDKTKPMVAITLDDGPGKRTMDLLNVLEQNGAHATFFMQGMSVANYPEALTKMKEIGCELGNHSWNHPQLTKLDPAGIQQQVGDTNAAISAVVGENATVLRPPYGAINDTVRASAGMPLILWSVDTLDWKTKSKDATVQSILSAQDGDIILLHDIHDWSVDAAIEAIPQLIAKGYQLVTVSEMAEAKGTPLQNGEKYTDFSVRVE
ncbi:MAG: polysaccharide deacetylase family protein [Lachnospiraceae bacterium]